MQVRAEIDSRLKRKDLKKIRSFYLQVTMVPKRLGKSEKNNLSMPATDPSEKGNDRFMKEVIGFLLLFDGQLGLLGPAAPIHHQSARLIYSQRLPIWWGPNYRKTQEKMSCFWRQLNLSMFLHISHACA